MSAIPYDVVDAFVAGKRKRRGNFSSDGQTLLSYHREIAYHTGNGIIINLPSPYYASITTNIHLAACYGMTDKHGKSIRKVAPRTWEVVEVESADDNG